MCLHCHGKVGGCVCRDWDGQRLQTEGALFHLAPDLKCILTGL